VVSTRFAETFNAEVISIRDDFAGLSFKPFGPSCIIIDEASKKEHIAAPLSVGGDLPTLAELKKFVMKNAKRKKAKIRVYSFEQGISVEKIADLILEGGSDYDKDGNYIRKRMIASLVTGTNMVAIKLSRSGTSRVHIRVGEHGSIRTHIHIRSLLGLTLRMYDPGHSHSEGVFTPTPTLTPTPTPTPRSKGISLVLA
jgi:hypothetical protein